jgi:uncharacterized membrane protein (UPF0127 family)
MRLRVAAAVVLAFAAGCSSDGSGTPSTTPTSGVSTTAAFAAFGRATIVLTSASGATSPGCVLVADTDELRQRGLMEVTDLAGYDGMVFRWSSPVTERFWMKKTRIALSIAFFDSAGRFVSAADMEPCPDSVTDCPLTGAAGPYTDAIEVPKGALGALGAVSGSTLTVGAPCTPGG